MAIHRPDVFHNTIGVASVNAATTSAIESPTTDTPFLVAPVSSTSNITAKNIKDNAAAKSPDLLKLTAVWLGYYFIVFNCNSAGGTNGNWRIEPYKNGASLGYGKIQFKQLSITGERLPYYEISTGFIAKLQKDDYVEMYLTLTDAEAPEVALTLQNMSFSIYQLEQVGIH